MKSLIIALSLLLVPAVPASAGVAIFDACSGTSAEICQETDTGSVFEEGGILRNGLQVFIYAVGFASLVMITVGGFKYVVSRGDPQATAGARNTIIYAVIGLVVALVAQGILTFVVSTVSGG